MDHLGALLLALCVFSFLLFLLRVLLIACRSFPLSLRLKEEQARRQMEINVSNSCNGGSGGATNACMTTQDEVTVLPKTLDLPPSYDEAAFSDRKQDSTLTIATSLAASNPNLAAGINEPPPVYEANVATTTTSTTTTVFLVNGQPPVV
ncbi:uncharacterized protein LOC128254195 isoform X2 [Drosophila gunungcola]|uniref:uncharacterized protein LOC128254195 isoform X2 n=1 Tax=Drosophila gunungcola TaxID=103775 RepID=UPI0022E291A3|nr:uncharacterized protein LOC128254195 isoform X2 [Drosophila gunungcola]XP_052839047.1 uncharacterized protein LOC128254195 isoform X2 [Drosophila gunungcola]